MESLSLPSNLLNPGKRIFTICLGNKIANHSNTNSECFKDKTNHQQESSRLGVTNPSYPYLDELNQIELEAPIKGYLNKLVSRKWFTPLWLNNINSKGSWRTTYCILRANKLYYYQNQLGLGLDKKNCGQINLDYYDVCEPLNDNDKGPKYSFLIYSSLASVSSSSKSAQSRHIFSADSAFEMFKWISSIQNAIKDARVNRKGPGRRRQDKSKHGGNHTVDGSRHKTAPPETIKFDTDRVEPVSILHCEQKNRPRGPTGRRAPGRAFLHSTILGGSSVGNLIHSSTGDLLAITETNSLESSTEMTGSMDSSDNLEQKHNNNHHQMYNHHNHHRPRTMTTETVDTDADDYEEERDSKTENEEDNHYDTIVNESNRRIIGIMNKMRLEGEEKIKMSNGFGKGDASHDNHGDKQANLISKSNESNGTSNHFHANIARLNGKHTNGYSSSSPPINKTITATSPSIKRRFHEDTKDLKKHLNAIFSNNNQQNQQLMVNLGDSTVSIEQTKLTECLKEICPTLTSGVLLSEGSQVKSSLTDLDPNLRSLIKELEALKGVKKSKVRSEKIQSLVDKLVNLVDTYSKNVESFENYNDQIIKLISSLSTLVSQPTPMVTSSSTSSPSSSPRLVNANKLHYKPVNSPSSTHC